MELAYDSRTQFSIDKWAENLPSKLLCPSIYALSDNKGDGEGVCNPFRPATSLKPPHEREYKEENADMVIHIFLHLLKHVVYFSWKWNGAWAQRWLDLYGIPLRMLLQGPFELKRNKSIFENKPQIPGLFETGQYFVLCKAL